MQRKFLGLMSALAAAAALSACGGGSSDLGGGTVVPPGQTIQVTDAPPSALSTRSGTVFRLSAKVQSYTTALSEMKWSAVTVTPGAPTLVLTDPNCTGASRNDNFGQTGFKSSTWECQSSTVAPIVTRDTVYQVTISGKDEKGASASRTTQITVAAIPAADLAALRPTVVTTPSVTVRGGAPASLTCIGTPGASTSSTALTYAWRIKSNPNGLSLPLTDADKSSVRFAAPTVITGSPVRVTFECGVTDANGHSAAAEVAVTIASEADSVALPGVTGPSNGSVALFTGVESQLSCLGTGGYIANDGSGLRYRWVVKTNPSGILLDLVGSDQQTVRIKPGAMPPGVSTASTTAVLQCRVSDDASRTVSVDVPVTITRNDVATSENTVVANAGLSKSVAIGAIVALDGSQSRMVGVPNAQLYYQWSQESGPTVSLSSANTVSPSFRAPNNTSVQTLRFKLVVAGVPITSTYVPKATEVSYVDITVASAAMPRITLPPVTQAAGGVSQTLFATVTDNPESLPVYFKWSQISGTAVTIQTPNAPTISFFTPIVPGAFQDLVFNVEASFDPAFPTGSTASADAIIRVTGTGN